MRSFIRIIFVLISLSSLLSCYEDLGNYDYQKVDEMTIDLPKVIHFNLPVAGAELCELKPQISRTLIEGEQHLKYTWAKQITKNFKTSWLKVGNDKTYRHWIKSTDTQRDIFRFDVLDTLTGLGACQVIEVWKRRPFFASWFILQEINGQIVLGCVDFSGDKAVVTEDIRRATLGTQIDLPQEKLEGKPRFMLGVSNYGETKGAGRSSILEIFTDQGGYLLDGTRLNVRYNYNQLLFLNLNLNVAVNPQYASVDYGEVIINNGVFWHANADGSSVYYPVRLSEDAGSSYDASLAVVSYRAGGAFVYDQANKRFLYYNNKELSQKSSENSQIRGGSSILYNPSAARHTKLTLLKEVYGSANLFDPNKIEAEKMLFMGTNEGGKTVVQTKALAVGMKGAECLVYELCFDAWDEQKGAVCSGIWKYKPSISPEKWSIAASAAFDQTFFYAAGNKIFRVNLAQQQPKEYVVYAHPSENVEFLRLKFQSERARSIKGEEDKEGNSLMNEQTRELGVIIKYGDGREGIMTLRMGANGMLLKGNTGVVEEYLGFKNMVDIGYTYQYPF